MDTSLHHAIMHSDLDDIEIRLAAAGDLDDLDDTLLHVAIASGRPAVVRLLLAAGVDPDRLDGTGTAPMQMVFRHGQWTDVHEQMLALLLTSGADPRPYVHEATFAGLTDAGAMMRD